MMPAQRSPRDPPPLEAYGSTSPDAAAICLVGDTVERGTTSCRVEGWRDTQSARFHRRSHRLEGRIAHPSGRTSLLGLSRQGAPEEDQGARLASEVAGLASLRYQLELSVNFR